jgi:heparan-alpha-glucosaminide N-acetyltransferase
MAKFRDNKSDSDKPAKEERLTSLDAFRGSILLLFICGGFGLKQMLTDAQRWGWITSQWAHREWEGCTLWDLLLPAMLVCVGVAMPYSYANRQAKGHSWFRQGMHAFLRTGVLLALGVYLDSYRANRLVFDLHGDLQQIACAYLLAMVVLPLGLPAQGITVAFFLIGHTTAHVLHAFAGGHPLWSPTHNIDAALDGVLRLGTDTGHHVSLGIFAAAALVLCGALIGGLIRSGISPGVKVAIMTGVSFLCILLGWVLSGGGGWIEFSWFAVIPMIRHFTTWTFVLTTLGWTLLFFTYFYLIIDGIGVGFWSMPLMIVGRNPLFVYVTYRLFHGWAERSAGLILPTSPALMATLRPLLIALVVMAIYWLLSFWLYRRRIFFKV